MTFIRAEERRAEERNLWNPGAGSSTLSAPWRNPAGGEDSIVQVEDKLLQLQIREE